MEMPNEIRISELKCESIQKYMQNDRPLVAPSRSLFILLPFHWSRRVTNDERHINRWTWIFLYSYFTHCVLLVGKSILCRVVALTSLSRSSIALYVAISYAPICRFSEIDATHSSDGEWKYGRVESSSEAVRTAYVVCSLCRRIDCCCYWIVRESQCIINGRSCHSSLGRCCNYTPSLTAHVWVWLWLWLCVNYST